MLSVAQVDNLKMTALTVMEDDVLDILTTSVCLVGNDGDSTIGPDK